MAKYDNAAGDTQDEAEQSFGEKVKRELKEWGLTLAVFIPVFLLFSGLIYEQRVIPSESMVPTLEVSDRVAVSKFAYGYGRYSLPFSMGRYLPLGEGRVFARSPKRGDVVVFEHPHTPRVMIKRVIGLPGDKIQVIDEHVVLNGEPVQRDFIRGVKYAPHKRNYSVNASEFRETVGDKTWLTQWWGKGEPGDNTALFIVPEGHMFLMGDNRDNSLDGRAETGHCPSLDGVINDTGCPITVPAEQASVGFVPMNNLIGRADTVLLSFHRCKLESDQPCKKRVWKGL